MSRTSAKVPGAVSRTVLEGTSAGSAGLGPSVGAGGEGAVGADRQGRELLTYPTKGSGPCCEGGTLNLREW